MQQNRFLYLLSIDKSLKDKQIILLFLQKKIFLIKIIVNKYIQQQQIDTSIIKMRRLEESVADVMIPQDQYNRLVTVERTLAMELQEKTRKYELLERDYLRLYEQKKELERDVKNISSTSINLSSKMVGKQQAYLSNIKAMQNQMLETQQNYIDLIDKLKNEMSDRQKDHLQSINNLQEERQRIKNENQQLRVQIFDLKEKFDEKKRAYQQYQKELYTSLPDISQDSIVNPPIINNRAQPGTDKIQIIHKPQENIFFTQPSKKKQVQNAPPQDFHISNSISSIYTKRIADKIRKLRTQLQAAKDRLAQYEKINQQVRLSNISKQSSVIDASQSILRGKYIKLKVMYAQAQKKLSDSKIEFTKISNLIKVMKLDRT